MPAISSAAILNAATLARWHSHSDAVWSIAARKLDYIDSAKVLKDLEVPRGKRLEKLKGDREGQYSIRINQQYRICFDWFADQVENLEVVDYH